jgi:hypothetical protein
MRGKFGVEGRLKENWELDERFGPNLPLNETNLKIAEAGIS